MNTDNTAKRDYYDILGVAHDATEADVKKAWQRVRGKHHPDRNPDDGAPEKFKEAQKAYEVLSDGDERKRYDQTLEPKARVDKPLGKEARDGHAVTEAGAASNVGAEPESRTKADADTCTTKRWYVVHAYSGFEKAAMRSLKERIDLSNVKDHFGEVLVPTEEVVEMRAGKKRRSERKFFPGYVLVHMDLNEHTWHLVKETPRVMGFIGGKAEAPAPLSEKEADAILARVREGSEKPAPKTMFEPGELVRVIDGPFNDFNGVVEEVNYEKNRMIVAVTIFGRSTPVELDFSQVEKG